MPRGIPKKPRTLPTVASLTAKAGRVLTSIDMNNGSDRDALITSTQLSQAEERLAQLRTSEELPPFPRQVLTPEPPSSRAVALVTALPSEITSPDVTAALPPADMGDQLFAHMKLESLKLDPFWSPVISGTDPIAAMYAYACLSGLPPLDAVMIAWGDYSLDLDPRSMLEEARSLHRKAQHVFRRAAMSADIGPLWAARILKSIASNENNKPSDRIAAVLAARAMSTSMVEVRESLSRVMETVNNNTESDQVEETITVTERKTVLQREISSQIMHSMRMAGGSGLQTPETVIDLDAEQVDDGEEGE